MFLLYKNICIDTYTVCLMLSMLVVPSFFRCRDGLQNTNIQSIK